MYDANGNLVWDGETYREYNSLNQLSAVYNGSDNTTLLQSFTYHPLEERVLVKTTYNPDSSVKETVYYFSKEYVRVVNASGSFDTEYVYLNGDLVAEHDLWSDEKRFVSTDHLGSSSVVTDENGDILEETKYDPYGAIISGGEASRYDYEAKEHDPLTGDTDFHFRQYKSEYGIFTQPDTVVPNVYDPQSLNRYMFERGNPYSMIDLTGHKFIQNARQNAIKREYKPVEYWEDTANEATVIWEDGGFHDLYNEIPFAEHGTSALYYLVELEGAETDEEKWDALGKVGKHLFYVLLEAATRGTGSEGLQRFSTAVDLYNDLSGRDFIVDYYNLYVPDEDGSSFNGLGSSGRYSPRRDPDDESIKLVSGNYEEAYDEKGRRYVIPKKSD